MKTRIFRLTVFSDPSVSGIIREAVHEAVLSIEGIAVYVTYCEEAFILTGKIRIDLEDLVIVQCTTGATAAVVDQIFEKVTNMMVLVHMNDRTDHPECLKKAYSGFIAKLDIVGLPLRSEDIAILNLTFREHLKNFKDQISLVA